MRIVGAATLAALLLAGCGPKALTLPADPVDRAATCGVVAAASARAATADIKAPLPFEAQGRILHYPLLAASEGERFDTAIANKVSKRMSALQDDITSGEWQALVPQCAAAFPLAGRLDVTLPADRFEAELGCDEMGKFLSQALQAQEADYAKPLGEYRDLERKFDMALGPGLRSRVGKELKPQLELRSKAMAAMVKLGSPAAVMRQCVERFG